MLYSERDNTTRQCYLDDLSDASDEYGEENIVYFDESGFEEEVVRPHGWAPIGKKVHGEKSGSKRHRTNLIMAQSVSNHPIVGHSNHPYGASRFHPYVATHIHPNKASKM